MPPKPPLPKPSTPPWLCPSPRTTEPLLGDDAGEVAGEWCGELYGDCFGEADGDREDLLPASRDIDRSIFLRRISFFQFCSFHFHRSLTLMWSSLWEWPMAVKPVAFTTNMSGYRTKQWQQLQYRACPWDQDLLGTRSAPQRICSVCATQQTSVASSSRRSACIRNKNRLKRCNLSWIWIVSMNFFGQQSARTNLLKRPVSATQCICDQQHSSLAPVAHESTPHMSA